MDILEQKGIIRSEQREKIYSNGKYRVPYLIEEHLKNMERMEREKREFIEKFSEDSD